MNTIDIGNGFYIGEFDTPKSCAECSRSITVEIIGIYGVRDSQSSFGAAKAWTGVGNVRCISCSLVYWPEISGSSIEGIRKYLSEHPEIALEC